MVLHGRDRERERLLLLLAEARSSRGGALVVRGQPGVGKSALLADLKQAYLDTEGDLEGGQSPAQQPRAGV